MFFRKQKSERGDVLTFIRQVMAQSFSPPEQTEETFHYLKRRASTALLQALMDVWRKLIRNPLFPVSNWSVFMFSVRTSIDLEGWYNRLNARVCRTGRVSLYMLLIELYKEATGIHVPLDARLLSEWKKERINRKKTNYIC